MLLAEYSIAGSASGCTLNLQRNKLCSETHSDQRGLRCALVLWVRRPAAIRATAVQGTGRHLARRCAALQGAHAGGGEARPGEGGHADGGQAAAAGPGLPAAGRLPARRPVHRHQVTHGLKPAFFPHSLLQLTHFRTSKSWASRAWAAASAATSSSSSGAAAQLHTLSGG